MNNNIFRSLLVKICKSKEIEFVCACRKIFLLVQNFYLTEYENDFLAMNLVDLMAVVFKAPRTQ